MPDRINFMETQIVSGKSKAMSLIQIEKGTIGTVLYSYIFFNSFLKNLVKTKPASIMVVPCCILPKWKIDMKLVGVQLLLCRLTAYRELRADIIICNIIVIINGRR